MHKKNALGVDHDRYNVMEKMVYPNKDFIARSVGELLFGRFHPINPSIFNIGFNSGFRRVILFGNSVSSRGIVHLPLSILKTIGSTNDPGNRLIILISSIWSLMPPTFIRMAVYSI
jgi:hypothetical protein